MRETTIVGDAACELKKSIARISPNNVPADTVSLARTLLGKVLVREFGGGRIVEAEAYLRDDPACHAFRGMTQRNRSLFLEHGHSYVYLCYGTSYLLNVSSEAAGIGSGVLLRALEPLQGSARMQRRLTAALKVDRRHDGLNLFADEQLWIGSDGHKVSSVGESVRIGLTKAADLRLRFFVAGSHFLSGPRSLNAYGKNGA
jgi:DNA-3-methyladenine glycosylase